jgi:hypothetical protein
MKKIITDTIKQFTPVHSLEHGKGYVLSVTFRRDNNLVMCYFPKSKVHEWIGETELRSNVGDITLKPVNPKSMDESVPDSLQAALESLFAPRPR